MATTSRAAQPTPPAVAPSGAAGGNNNSNRLNLNYRSPQEAYNDALNYSEDDADDYAQSMQDKHGKMEKLMSNMLKGVNDSKYLYPAIAIIIITILVVLILFQKIAVSTKVIASLLLIVFIAFTVFLNKH